MSSFKEETLSLNLYIAPSADAYDRGGTKQGIIVVAKWQSCIQRIDH